MLYQSSLSWLPQINAMTALLPVHCSSSELPRREGLDYLLKQAEGNVQSGGGSWRRWRHGAGDRMSEWGGRELHVNKSGKTVREGVGGWEGGALMMKMMMSVDRRKAARTFSWRIPSFTHTQNTTQAHTLTHGSCTFIWPHRFMVLLWKWAHWVYIDSIGLCGIYLIITV